MKSALNLPFKPAVRLFRKLLDVQRVHQPVHRHQHVGLLANAVDPLADCHEPVTGEAQLLDDVALVRLAPGEPARVIDQKHIERARLTLDTGKKLLQAGPIAPGGGYFRIGENVLFQNLPALPLRVFPAFPDLVIER